MDFLTWMKMTLYTKNNHKFLQQMCLHDYSADYQEIEMHLLQNKMTSWSAFWILHLFSECYSIPMEFRDKHHVKVCIFGETAEFKIISFPFTHLCARTEASLLPKIWCLAVVGKTWRHQAGDQPGSTQRNSRGQRRGLRGREKRPGVWYFNWFNWLSGFQPTR